jgi:hypothetical protein
MSATQMRRQAPLTGQRQETERSASRWRHPFDSARGTIALGVLLTVVLIFALRLLNG